MATKEPKIIRDKNEMRKWSRSIRAQGKSIGLVPTMGYLHQGHLSLLKEARKHAQYTVVSIYVNPGQFSPNEDLSTYPSDFPGDVEKLKSVPGGVDVIFNPKNLYDYGDNNVVGVEQETRIEKVVSCVENNGTAHETWIRVENLEKGLCGKSRPVFFRGVATIVCKLFNIVEPDIVVFGKKDYQQWRIIQRMVRDLDFDIKVIGAEITRDPDGLAMSSRNVNLSPQERDKALSISRSLAKAKAAVEKGEISSKELRNSVVEAIQEAGGKVDYATVVEQESLEEVVEVKMPVVFCVAAWFGKALAEALNERIESTVGEFLSTIGRLQAEQQKQVVDFQEEVSERAKKAKEKAAREAMESTSPPSFSTTKITKVGGTSAIVPSSASDDVSIISPSSPTSGLSNGDNDQNRINIDPY